VNDADQLIKTKPASDSAAARKRNDPGGNKPQ